MIYNVCYVYIYYITCMLYYIWTTSHLLLRQRCRNFHPSTVTPRVVTENAFYVPGNLAMAMAVVVLVVLMALVVVDILFGQFGNIPCVCLWLLFVERPCGCLSCYNYVAPFDNVVQGSEFLLGQTQTLDAFLIDKLVIKRGRGHSRTFSHLWMIFPLRFQINRDFLLPCLITGTYPLVI